MDMDWASFPRLVSGRVFTKSPHLYDGDVEGTKHQELSILGTEKVSIETMYTVQQTFQSEMFGYALKEDPHLASNKVFHWKSAQGIHYWLPIMEGRFQVPSATRAKCL
ncbi:MAG: hypothetical protein Q9N62_01850 [Ghiorsea sp.]|nr:hypothetical protein [Ghiorsea sp.]MDQ7057259.1 hypothetical protein [Ghiorsea sp.]